MSDIQQVRRVFRKHMLAQICTMPERAFGPAFGMETIQTTHYAPDDYYHYRDNGSTVLAVAHLDTVVPCHRRKVQFRNTVKGPMIVSGALDDRLGAYVILGLLPKLGIRCDYLLTVGEEWGQSTAEEFEPSKDYDWIIEFDRTGTDVVMYQYEDEPCRQAVKACGARMGIGSFSDIAYLEHLGVKAFNWGVGYRGNYHSEHGYAYLRDTFAMVARYARFHRQNAGITMCHEPAPAYETYGEGMTCYVCQGKNAVDYVTMICDVCGTCADCLEHKYDCQCYTPASSSISATTDNESPDDAISGAFAAFQAIRETQ